MIYIKYCIKCGEAYDIDTNKDLCPKCRNKFEVEGDEEKRSTN
jgi:Zn finger protein HypA/HybF involved in hydrogenase expression|tara:strand:+ start:859 stop:987 length:129 start_codon:yes stop_codon:yes gene_type:complete